MICVSSVKTLIQYYDLFKAKQVNSPRPLKIGTIFSYAANEEDPNADGFDVGLIPDDLIIPESGRGASKTSSYSAQDNQASYLSKGTYSRDRLDEFMADYNTLFGTKYSTQDNQSYYK